MSAMDEFEFRVCTGALSIHGSSLAFGRYIMFANLICTPRPPKHRAWIPKPFNHLSVPLPLSPKEALRAQRWQSDCSPLQLILAIDVLEFQCPDINVLDGANLRLMSVYGA